jgi:hypothetical protein
LIVAGVSAGLAVLGMQVSGMAGQMEPPQGPVEASAMPSLGEIGRRLDDIEAAIALTDRPWETLVRGGDETPYEQPSGWQPLLPASSGVVGSLIVTGGSTTVKLRDGSGVVLFQAYFGGFSPQIVPLNIRYTGGLEIDGVYNGNTPAITLLYRADPDPIP